MKILNLDENQIKPILENQMKIRTQGIVISISLCVFFVLLGLYLHSLGGYVATYDKVNFKTVYMIIWGIVGVVWCGVSVAHIKELWQIKLNPEYWLLTEKKYLIEDIYQNNDVEINQK